MRKIVLTILAMGAACGLAGTAAAETFPSHPVTLIVPFAAGGPSDTVARVVAQGMSQALGQSVIVENIGGAAGTIAAARVARATPDGYTLAEATWSTHVVSPVVYQHLSYDVLKDFVPVALLTQTPEVLLSKKTLPANDLHGLIAWLKANPNAAFQGVAGGTDEVAGYFFKQKTGTQFQYVPYRGLTLAMQDLVAGRIDLMFDQPSDALAQIRAGTIKAYAVMADRRLGVAPEIPTVDEAGLPGVYLSTWQAIFAPKGTPDDAIAKLNAAAQTALADPTVRKRLADIAQDVVPRDQQSPAALAAFYKSETEKWWPIIKAAGIKAE
ncbi:MAG TPA: tripartite tricarboxylate transporter substrate-binding protein [Xanthobacteraceae bacterium]|nr:tripartite tricarboxylate transporter substrate-binding protein [Xanthobacteraceae bacterium]